MPASEPAVHGLVRIGASSCLLGEAVRYDGGHKRDRWLTDVLGRFVTFVPVCPEVEIGLGTPRPTIRLEQAPGGVRLVEPKSGDDLTDRMTRFAERRVAALAKMDLDGYVLKKGSPSCGMERVKVWDRNGVPKREGAGLFAAVLRERLPHLPVEEEGRLEDEPLRENFVERIFAHRRVKSLFAGRWTAGDVVRFHSAEKYLLLAHEPKAYENLGRLVARVKQVSRAEFREQYFDAFMRAMARKATVRSHVNVLQHMAGFFRDHVEDSVRAELAQIIADYRAGLLPLIVPITLVRHLARRHSVAYLTGQRYLEPSPAELMLRCRI